MSECASCHAEVIWVTIHPGGRRMPVDATPDTNGTVLVDLDADGGPAGVVLSKPSLAMLLEETPEEPLYLSHFATCPQAARWRRQR